MNRIKLIKNTTTQLLTSVVPTPYTSDTIVLIGANVIMVKEEAVSAKV